MARRTRRRARASSQAGPRRADGSFYKQKPKGKRRSRKGKARVVTSKSGRTYKRGAGGRFVQVGRKGKSRSRKGSSRKGRRPGRDVHGKEMWWYTADGKRHLSFAAARSYSIKKYGEDNWSTSSTPPRGRR